MDIKIFKKFSLEDFFSEFNTANSKLDTGSLNAINAASSVALFERAVLSLKDGEREEWLKRNALILKNYMIHLIDDDVKARAGLLKEIKTGNSLTIEAAIHPACTINEEIINMLHQMLELAYECSSIIDKEMMHYLKESAQLAIGTIKSCIIWLINITSQCTDDTYKYIVKRENEITLEECESLCRKILES